jgi:hypothetical protein
LPNGPIVDRLWDEFRRDTQAAKSADPERFKREWDAHGAARDAHLKRIEAERPPPSPENVIECIAWFHEVREEARALASADGCPDPSDALSKPAPPPESDDPLERMKRASLPRSTLRDLEDSQTRTAEEHDYERIRAEQRAAVAEVEDKLAPFRHQSSPGMPPAWPDY